MDQCHLMDWYYGTWVSTSSIFLFRFHPSAFTACSTTCLVGTYSFHHSQHSNHIITRSLMISQTKADWVIMVVIKQSFWFIVYSNCVWSSILRMHWCTNFQSHNSLCGLGEWSLKSLLGRGHVHCWYLTHSIWCLNSIQGSIIYLFVYSHTKRWPYLSLSAHSSAARVSL